MGVNELNTARANREMDKTGTLAPIQDALAMSTEEAAPLLVDIGVAENMTCENGQFMKVGGRKLTQ